jgi:hypothetical protein
LNSDMIMQKHDKDLEIKKLIQYFLVTFENGLQSVI